MRRIVAYEAGRAVWSDNQPSYARAHGIRGSLVIGGPGPNDRDVHRSQQVASKAKKEAA